jgi:hypothetical protein
MLRPGALLNIFYVSHDSNIPNQYCTLLFLTGEDDIARFDSRGYNSGVKNIKDGWSISGLTVVTWVLLSAGTVHTIKYLMGFPSLLLTSCSPLVMDSTWFFRYISVFEIPILLARTVYVIASSIEVLAPWDFSCAFGELSFGKKDAY